MLIQILTATFSGDLAQALDQFDRLVQEYERHCDDSVACPACSHTFKRGFDEQLKAGLVVANIADKKSSNTSRRTSAVSTLSRRYETKS